MLHGFMKHSAILNLAARAPFHRHDDFEFFMVTLWLLPRIQFDKQFLTSDRRNARPFRPCCM